MERDDLSLIIEGLDRILSDAPLDVIDAASGQGPQAEALWSALVDNGYTALCVAPEHGGLGASLADAAELASHAAMHALALPLGDSVLAAGLISMAGQQPPDGAIAIADPLDASAPISHMGQVPHLLALDQGRLRCLALGEGDVSMAAGGEDAAGSVKGPARVALERDAPDWLNANALRALAALLRSAQMSGAMQAILRLTLGYTQEREQFGRPLAKFQAIQHHLADIACETAASIAAVELACDALRADPLCGDATQSEIAIAKIRCGQAASRVAAAAHQAHGAMGFTREYALGRFTRRLWQWQDEFGSEVEWSEMLGRAVLGSPDPRLWPRISQSV